MHGLGITHEDIHGSNILIDDLENLLDVNVVLIDFGAARLTSNADRIEDERLEAIEGNSKQCNHTGASINDPCSPRRIAVSYATYNALRMLYPNGNKTWEGALGEAVRECPYDPVVGNAGFLAAQKAFFTRNTLILPPNPPKYKWYSEVEKWKPRHIPIDPNGPVQKFLTEEWGRRWTFGVRDGSVVYVPPPKDFLREPGKVDMENKTILIERNHVLHTYGSRTGLNRTLDRIVNPEFIKQAIHVLNTSET